MRSGFFIAPICTQNAPICTQQGTSATIAVCLLPGDAMPNSQDWIKALKLLIASYCGAVVFMFFFWSVMLVTAFISIATFTTDVFVLGLFALLALLIGFGWFALTAVIWRWILLLFWSHPPQWMTPNLDIKNIAFNYGISAWATLPISIIWFIQVAINTQLKLSDLPSLFRAYPPDLIVSLFWLLFIFAALGCSYQRRTQR